MDTLQLKLFVSLAQTLNFTKTANEFYVTQPTVSNYIKALESNMGVRLLNRDSHSVSLTPEGREFVSYAKQIIAMELEAETRLRNIADGRRGYIKAAILSSCALHFSICMDEFVKSFPGIQVNVDLLEGSEMTTSILKKSHDIYFAHKHMIPDSGDIDYVTISDAQLHLFVNSAIADTIDMDDWSTIGKHHFVSTPAQDFTLSANISRICAHRGIKPDIINYYNRADMAFLAVNAGVGVAILPPQLQSFYNCPNVVGFPIDGDDAHISQVVAWQRDTGNPDVKRFLGLRAISEFK